MASPTSSWTTTDFQTADEGCSFDFKIDQSVPAVLAWTRSSCTVPGGTLASNIAAFYAAKDFGLFAYVVIDGKKIDPGND